MKVVREKDGSLREGEGLGVFRSTPSVSFAAQSGQSARRACREETAIFCQQITSVLQQVAQGVAVGLRENELSVLSVVEESTKDRPQIRCHYRPSVDS